MRIIRLPNSLQKWFKLLRWDKPSGRLILLIPAGWALWLTPTAPPEWNIFFLIVCGGILVSGAGCIANDIWDRNIDKRVERTKKRPLATNEVNISAAFTLLFALLILSLFIVLSLPEASQSLCLKLALLALPTILIYPSSKRWFKYPQALLSICWGFAVLIPWAASESNLNGGFPLTLCWISTILWTFGFDTVYSMSDRKDDKSIGLNSSALSLKENTLKTVRFSYLISSISIGMAGLFANIGWIFWPIWLVAIIGMQTSTLGLNQPEEIKSSAFNLHFRSQVWLGSLILFGFILGRI